MTDELEKIVDLAKNYQLDWANYNIKELNKMGIQRTNGDEVSEDTNLIPRLTVKLTLPQWVWLNKLIGETQGTLTSIAMQSTDEEHKHFIKPCLALEKDWDFFIENIRKATE